MAQPPAANVTFSARGDRDGCFAPMATEYTIELCREGGPRFGTASVLEHADDLTDARRLYQQWARQLPNGVVILCHRGHILARSDMPDETPE
jgi:hypothetical protein